MFCFDLLGALAKPIDPYPVTGYCDFVDFLLGRSLELNNELIITFFPRPDIKDIMFCARSSITLLKLEHLFVELSFLCL